MERKIGEIFEFRNEWYQVVENPSGGCNICNFMSKSDGCTAESVVGRCGSSRSDRKLVGFKKLEKVGEPFALGCGKWMQKYTCFMMRSKPSNLYSYYDSNGKFINIEIKEDMEENNNAKHSNSENIGKNLKEFNLEAAKSGKPVCTRDGRKARIICFNLNSDEYPIVVAITNNEEENEIHRYSIDGKICTISTIKENDLMMLPEKKEGWVNIYPYQCKEKVAMTGAYVYKTQKEAKEVASGDCIATISIEWEE